MSWIKCLTRFFREKSCDHRFDYDDLIGRPTPDGNVTWPCWKCGKVFSEPCGLDVLRHGSIESKPK